MAVFAGMVVGVSLVRSAWNSSLVESLAGVAQSLLLEIGHDVVDPAARLLLAGAAVGIADVEMAPTVGGITSGGVGVVIDRQGELLQVVLALNLASRLACRLNGRQQQGNENADDGDDHQQFNESETPSAAAMGDDLEHD